MRFHYYPDTDSLYIDLVDRASVSSAEVAAGIVLDFDEDGRLVGIDIDHASEAVNLTSLEVDSLPLGNVVMRASTEAAGA